MSLVSNMSFEGTYIRFCNKQTQNTRIFALYLKYIQYISSIKWSYCINHEVKIFYFIRIEKEYIFKRKKYRVFILFGISFLFNSSFIITLIKK